MNHGGEVYMGAYTVRKAGNDFVLLAYDPTLRADVELARSPTYPKIDWLFTGPTQ